MTKDMIFQPFSDYLPVHLNSSPIFRNLFFDKFNKINMLYKQEPEKPIRSICKERR